MFTNGYFVSNCRYEYDSFGISYTTSVSVEENNYRTTSISDKHDRQGNIIESIHSDSYATLCSKETYQYDKYGNVADKKYYNANGELIKPKSYKYEYDSHNNWIKLIAFEPGKHDSIPVPHIIVEREIGYYK